MATLRKQGRSAPFSALTALWLVCVALPASARDFHVDPYRGQDADSGSESHPWRSLKAALNPGILQPGDTVYLASGYYGDLHIFNRRNRGTVTIAARSGHWPRFKSVLVRASAGWLLRGFGVSASLGRGDRRDALVTIRESESITIEDFTAMSAEDISSWRAADWVKQAVDGIAAGGARITLRNNRIRNVRHGITVSARHSLVLRNTIQNFTGDGVRALGSYTTYRNNTVKNCYKVDDHHDDGFQSWSVGPFGRPGGGEVIGVTISGNMIINYEDPAQPFRCLLQGIGLFDGMFVDWTIENNVVITDHWHGITVMGARNVRVVNNTVIDPNRRKPGPPWITITRHKDGRPPLSSIIANNIAPSFNPRGNSHMPPTGKTGVAMVNNLILTDPGGVFVDAETFDLRPKPGGLAMDRGDARYAPTTDIRGRPRPVGAAVDIGAYEGQ